MGHFLKAKFFFEKIFLGGIFMYKKRLILIRETLSFTQREMAFFLGVSKSNYARWETGETLIPFKHLLCLANKTHYSVDYCLGLNSNSKKRQEDIVYTASFLGKHLKEFRKNIGYNQKEFALSLHTTQSVISSYEQGKTIIQTSFLYDICRKYHVSADLFLEEELEVLSYARL